MPIWLRMSEHRKHACHELVFDDLEHPGVVTYSLPTSGEGCRSLNSPSRARPLGRTRPTAGQNPKNSGGVSSSRNGRSSSR